MNLNQTIELNFLQKKRENEFAFQKGINLATSNIKIENI